VVKNGGDTGGDEVFVVTQVDNRRRVRFRVARLCSR